MKCSCGCGRTLSPEEVRRQMAGESHFSDDGFPDIFSMLFSGAGEDPQSMKEKLLRSTIDVEGTRKRLAKLSKREREEAISEMPDELKEILGISVSTVRKQAGYILGEAKLRGRDQEISQLEEVVENFVSEVSELDKKLQDAGKTRQILTEDFQKDLAQRDKDAAKARKKLKKKLAAAGDEIARLQEQIAAKNNALSQHGNELKDLRSMVYDLENIATHKRSICDLILSIDTSANKPVLVEQIAKLQEIAQGNGATPAEDDQTASSVATTGDAVNTESAEPAQ